MLLAGAAGTRVVPPSDSQARPFPDFRDAHAPVRLPTHRDLVQPRSRVQAGAESVAAPLVRAHALNIEVLTDLQPVNAVGDLAVLARLLDARTEIGVPQRDAVSVAARGIDNLTRQGRNRARRSSYADADRMRWTGWRSPRSRRVALSVRTFPLRTQCVFTRTSSGPPSLLPTAPAVLRQFSCGRRLTSSSFSAC